MPGDLLFVPLTTAPGAGPDVASQTSTALAEVDTRLRAHHGSLADAVAMTVYLRRAEDFAAMNGAYRSAWTAALPTRTTVVVPLPESDALVGIAAVGVRSGSPREVLHPEGWLPSPNPYSYVIRAGGAVFLSGLLARSGRDQSVMGKTAPEQTRAIFANARELLASAGLGLEHVVSARVFLPDLREREAMDDVYAEYLPGNGAARSVAGAGLTAPPYRIEITFMARDGGPGGSDLVALISAITSVDAACCRPAHER
jgi:enamine deaminase RidA (YjgF/YER057c/UK114 family)